MLYLIQRSIEGFIENFTQNGFSDKNQAQYNAEINNIIDGTRDYLQAHYKINSRTDTQYWRDCRDNPKMSPILNNMLDGWLHSDNFDAVINTHMPQLSYLKTSWYCLFAGKGYYAVELDNIDEQSLSKEHKLMHQQVNSKTAEFYDHKQYLDMLHHATYSTEK